MNVRKSTIDDLPVILDIYAYSRELMRQNGNPTQWGTTNPPKEVILEDIDRQIGYAIENENGEICGAFAFIIGKEPTYQEIWDGEWLNDEPYGTIHRLASNGKATGIFDQCLSYCQTLINNIRIDTHRDNRAMLHNIEKYSFHRCGIIQVRDGTKRIAFQKTF